MTPGADAASRRRLLKRRDARDPSSEPSLYSVRMGDRWVFLDAARGEYLSLHDPQDALRVRTDGVFETDQEEIRTALSRCGLVDRAVAAAAAFQPHQVCDVSAYADRRPGRNVSSLDVARLLIALLATALELTRPFSALVRPLRSPAVDGPDSEALRQAALFARLLVWSPWQGECLFRSRWLLRYLQLQGCRAEWVFGVRGWPLRAHCWVQRGGRPLNERPDAVVAYRVLATF